MARHKNSKSKNQTIHFKRRCDERVGVQINRKDIQRKIKEQKFNENFYFLNRQSNRVSRYRYKFNNKWYIIPYDKNTHKVITIFEDNKQDVQEVLTTQNTIERKSFFTCFINIFKYFIKIIYSYFKK